MTPTPSKPSRRPKSPPAPSSSLKDCVSDVGKLYGTYARGSFSRPELASILEVAADSGPTNQKIFTLLKGFGLLVADGDKFKVSEEFVKLKNATPGTPEFKRAAYSVIIRNNLFKELIDSFHSKLPARSAVTMRLEQEKGFNQERAGEVARVLEESLKYTCVLDASGNIVVPRDDQTDGLNELDQANGLGIVSNPAGNSGTAIQNNPSSYPPSLQGALKIEIALKENRKSVVFYPQDLSGEEAEKIGKVLKAIVS